MSRRTKFAKLTLGSSKSSTNLASDTRPNKSQSTYISKFFNNGSSQPIKTPSDLSQNSLASTETVEEDENEPVPKKRIRINGKEIVEKSFEMGNELEAVSVMSPKSQPPANNIEKDLKAIYSKTADKISNLKAPDSPATSNSIDKFFKDNNRDADNDGFVLTRTRVLPAILQAEAKAKAKAKRKPRAPRTTKAGKLKQPDIRKMIKKNYNDEEIFEELVAAESAADEICPYQLQMAIALSKSILETDGIEEDDATASSSSKTSDNMESTQERVAGLRHTLEQYGFKCKNSYDDQNLQSLLCLAGKKSKKWTKTPTLLLRRNRERQEQIVAERVQLVLQSAFDWDEQSIPQTHKLPAYTVHSRYLQEFHKKSKILFRMNSNDNGEVFDIYDYYLTGLVEVSTVQAGQLLKDWSKIPGRERTPERRSSFDDNWNALSLVEQPLPVSELKIAELEQYDEYCPSPRNRPSSPDLFMQESSDDEGISKQRPSQIQESSQTEVPSFYIEGIDSSLSKTSKNLNKSIEDLFEMSDETENDEANEDVPNSVDISSSGLKSPLEVNIEVPETPEHEENETALSSDELTTDWPTDNDVTLKPAGVRSSQISKIVSISDDENQRTLTANVAGSDNCTRASFSEYSEPLLISVDNESPGSADKFIASNLPPSDRISQISETVSISDDENQKTLTTVAAVMSCPQTSFSEYSETLLISDDNESLASAEKSVSPEVVENSSRASFPSLSPSSETSQSSKISTSPVTERSPPPKKSLDDTIVYYDKDSPVKDDEVFIISDDSNDEAEAVIEDNDDLRSENSLDQSIANIISKAKNFLNVSMNQSQSIPLPSPKRPAAPRKSGSLKKFKSDSFLLSESTRITQKPVEFDIEELSEGSDNETRPKSRVQNNASYDDFDELVFGKRVEPDKAEVSFIDFCHDDVEFEKQPLTPVSKKTKKTPPHQTLQPFECPNPVIRGHKDVFFIKVLSNETKPKYESMKLEELLQELHKVGLKPLKRMQAIKMLDYIYHQTHLSLEIGSDGNVTLNTTVDDSPALAPSEPTDPMTQLMAKYGLVETTTKKGGRKVIKIPSEVKPRKGRARKTNTQPALASAPMVLDGDELAKLEREFMADDGFAAELENGDL